MAEREEIQKRYAYHEMSNKVERADPSQRRRRRGEATGEVESLRGRAEVGRMGDRVAKTEKTEFTSKIERARKKRQKREHPSSATGGRENTVVSGGQSILDMGNLTGYQPSTDSARAAYENLLVSFALFSFFVYTIRLLDETSPSYLASFLILKTMIGSRSILGDQSTSVLRDAAESVIETLKDPNMRDPERHQTISQLLTRKPASTPGGISSEQFANLVQFGKQMDDYDDMKQKEASGEGEKVDDEMGVAVVFDESEEENEEKGDDSDAEEDVVVESSSTEDDEEEEEVMPQASDEEDTGEDVVVQGATEDDKKKASHAVDRILSVHEIDAHFLQRQLSRHYDDADVAADIANQLLEVLDIRNNSDLRECENKLLILLGFDLFDTIKLLLHNRVRVWACISMKRAQTEEDRNQIEEALFKEPSGQGKQVWEEMHSKGRAEDWTRDRLKGITDSLKKEEGAKDVSKALDSIGVKHEPGSNGDKDIMDIDKDGPLELDLDTLAFQDGAHTMSTKKCTLPDKSWRAMKKGYEEVHVPAVRSVIPKDERLIPIKELPDWTHAAFPGAS